MATPVELVAGGERRAVRARTADPDERAQLWPQVVSVYRGYAGYQRKTDREIPVVILEPRTGRRGRGSQVEVGLGHSRAFADAAGQPSESA